MKSASLVHAKAHLSELVDAAEHRGVSTIIKRHGKPSAVIVPVEVATPKKRVMSPDEIAALHAMFEGQGDPSFQAVADLVAGRR